MWKAIGANKNSEPSGVWRISKWGNYSRSVRFNQNSTGKRETKFTEQTGIFNFDKLVDDDGNMISSWLSAFINAHVDIVKDSWISKMGVDPFTYNMVNLLIRSGFGEAGMWFIAQPIIKDMANASSTASSQFTRDTFKYKSVYAA